MLYQVKKSTFPVILLFNIAILTGCGGGDSGNDPVYTSNSVNLDTNTVTEDEKVSSCIDLKDLNQVWLDKRLPCIEPGQNFVDLSRLTSSINLEKALENKTNIAYDVTETVYDYSFIDKIGVIRYYAFMCIKNAPKNHIGGESLDIGTDTALLFQFGKGFPDGVGLVQTRVESTTWDTTCDPKTHPLIIDYETGKVESVNVETLDTIRTEDLLKNN